MSHTSKKNRRLRDEALAATPEVAETPAAPAVPAPESQPAESVTEEEES